MRRVVLLALLALALPTAALATTVDTDYSSFSTGTQETFSGTLPLSAGETFVLTFNNLSINGSGGGPGSGSITFDITVGTATSTGFMIGAGSTVTVTGPSNTTLFSGSFGPGGTITTSGTSVFGIFGQVSGVTIASFSSGGACPSSSLLCGSGSADVNVSAVPEPGTLGLLGTGLVGLAAMVRRKLRG